MTDASKEDSRHLLFSQREGKMPLPEPMQLKQVPYKIRAKFRDLIEKYVFTQSIVEPWHPRPEYIPVLNNFFTEFYGSQCDQYGQSSNNIYEQFRDDIEEYYPHINSIMLKGEYHTVLSFAEYILRSCQDQKCYGEFLQSIRDLFENNSIAYYIEDFEKLPTIVPRTSEASCESNHRAIQNLIESDFSPAVNHFQKSAELINSRDCPGSVGESLKAIESVARTFNPDHSNTLSDALKSLHDKGLLEHKAPKEGFIKIFGYGSDSVRHGSPMGDQKDISMETAIFMYGACANFADYLNSTYQRLKDQSG